MKLFFDTLIVFFGTLMAAALVALGEPAGAELEMANAAAAPQAHASLVAWLSAR